MRNSDRQPPRPPRLAVRILERALVQHEAGPSILGDLQEDFARVAARRGRFPAAVWYWKEASLLAVSVTLTGRTAAGRGRRISSSRGGPRLPRTLALDLRYAWRFIMREPGFALLVAGIVGLGVGANTSVFSVMRPLMLAPLPVDDPHELVWIANEGTDRSNLSSVTSRSSNLRDFRELNRTFDGLTGFDAFSPFDSWILGGGAEPERVVGVGVVGDFLDVLGVDPLHGRSFTLEEGTPDGPPAVILDHGFWVRRFASDPDVVGRTLTVGGVAADVVGVLPPEFHFSSIFSPDVQVDFLYPFDVTDQTDARGNTLSLIGRLRTGVTVEAAQADLDAVVAGLLRDQPDRWGLGAAVSPLQEYVAAPYRPGLLLLVGAAAAVLLIVCVNVSNLLMARLPARLRTVAMQRAMGATRARLVRQHVLESVLVSAAGGVIGAAVAFLVVGRMSAAAGIAIPMLRDIAVDGVALGFTVGVAALVGVGVSVLPALQVTEIGEAAALKLGGLRAGTSRSARRLREALVVAQVAIACALLIVGGLFLRSFDEVVSVDLGYSPEDAVAWTLRRSQPSNSLTEDVAFFEDLVAQVTAVPGVESAGLVDALPLGRNRTWGVIPEGRVPGEADAYESVFPHIVDPGYLDAMRIPVVTGRGLTADDDLASERVALVSETAAENLFPGQDPIGRLVRLSWELQAPFRVVGVVGDVRHRTLEGEPEGDLYLPYGQIWQRSSLDLVVRSSLPPEALAPAVQSAIRGVDPGMPTRDHYALEERVGEAAAPRRFVLLILGSFAAAALLLASLGIFGVLSRSVAERTTEIGIRMALGATSSSIRRAVVVRTLLLSVAGAALGVALALVLSRLIASMLFRVDATDPLTFASMIALLLGVSVLAGWIPATRASGTESAVLMRG